MRCVSAANVGGTVFALLTVDGLGRRALLIWSGILMVISQVIVAVCLAVYMKPDAALPQDVGSGIVGVICGFVVTYACSWGKLPLILFSM